MSLTLAEKKQRVAEVAELLSEAFKDEEHKGNAEFFADLNKVSAFQMEVSEFKDKYDLE